MTIKKKIISYQKAEKGKDGTDRNPIAR